MNYGPLQTHVTNMVNWSFANKSFIRCHLEICAVLWAWIIYTF